MEIRKIKAEDTWQLRQEVMWPDKDISFVQLADDEKGIHFGLYEQETLVSVVSMFVKDHRGQFRKFATLPAYQCKGYGTFLLKHLIEQASRQGVEVIWCNARQEKSSFYKRFGLKETAQRFTKAGKTYVIMEAVLV